MDVEPSRVVEVTEASRMREYIVACRATDTCVRIDCDEPNFPYCARHDAP
jgi:hypothetical protein